MSRKAGSEDFKNKLQERLGLDEYNRIGAEGQDAPDSRGRYTAAEVKSELRGGQYGSTVEDRVAHFQGIADQEGGKHFNKKARDFLKSKYGVTFGKGKEETSTAIPTPAQQSGGGQTTGNVSGGTGSIVSPISQDNDIAIDGNRNTVNQDNSINQTVDNSDNSRRYYGGSSRTFNYKGGDGESSLYDSPTSKATMGGYYDTDDSPAAAAKFMDMYVDSNILGQRDIRRDYDKRKITDYEANDPGRVGELEGRLDRSIQGSRDRADEQERKMFGDNPYGGIFKLPQLPNPVVDNTQDIYEDAMDRFKKI